MAFGLLEDAAALTLFARGGHDRGRRKMFRHAAKAAETLANRLEVRRAVAAEIPEVDRFERISVACADNMAANLQQYGKCDRCALLTKNCICERLAALRKNVPDCVWSLGGQLGWAVWMHVKERGRSSNTGKILEHVIPGCEVFLHGVPADYEAFRKRVEEVEGRVFLLYPSSTAVSAAQAFGPSLDKELNGRRSGPCLVVLVDGTWRQARHMLKRPELSELRHVALASCGRSAFHWRRQSQEGRISTVEAGAYLLSEALALESRNAAEAALDAPAALRSGLAMLNAALERQNHMDCLKTPLPDNKRNRMPKVRPGERGLADTIH